MAKNGGITHGSSNGNYYDLSIVPNVYVVGEVGNPKARIVRIVHMSDTHDRHEDYISRIPNGHIFVHSGDFSNYSISRHFFKERDFNRQIDSLNAFFNRLPHAHKVFVAGNHDLSFDSYQPEYIQSKLTSAIYLQDSGCSLFGLNFYGVPWNRWRANAWARNFASDWSHVCKQWNKIPSSTDVLVSHIPPWSNDLYSTVTKNVQPVLHLFGHEHNGYGIKWKDKVLFSNAAMAQSESSGRHNGSSILSSGSGGGGSGGSTSSTVYRTFQRRNPIVVDVYVVSENFECTYPPYHPLTFVHPTDSHTDLSISEEDHQLQGKEEEMAETDDGVTHPTSPSHTLQNGHHFSSSKSPRQPDRIHGSRCTIS